jgi:hypothetical protein
MPSGLIGNMAVCGEVPAITEKIMVLAGEKANHRNKIATQKVAFFICS